MSGEGKKSVLVLISTMSLNRIQQQNQQRAMLFMKTKAIPFESIDGADPNCKERYVIILLSLARLGLDYGSCPSAAVC
jgi:hypothetical protein